MDQPPADAADLFERLPLPAFAVDAAGRLTSANARFRAMFPNARPGDATLPLKFDAATLPPDDPPLRLTRETGQFAEAELSLEHAGKPYWLRLRTAPRGGGAVATFEDLTELQRREQHLKNSAESAAKQLERLDALSDRLLDTRRILLRKNKELEATKAELERLSNTDALTGLWNRRHFDDAIAKEQARAERYFHPVSVFILDIDYFKKVNDTHGHPAGDDVLRAMGKLLVKSLRDVDIVARYGGEEFAAILAETELPNAAATAERVRVAVEAAKIPTVAGELSITVSIGVACSPDGKNLDALIALADQRLYAAKRGGRNRIVAE